MELMMAQLSGSAVVNAVIWVIVAGLIFWLLSWLIAYVGIPEPFSKIARVVLAIVAVLFLINALLMLTGHPLFTWR